MAKLSANGTELARVRKTDNVNYDYGIRYQLIREISFRSNGKMLKKLVSVQPDKRRTDHGWKHYGRYDVSVSDAVAAFVKHGYEQVVSTR
jgi:hypothetical protein